MIFSFLLFFCVLLSGVCYIIASVYSNYFSKVSSRVPSLFPFFCYFSGRMMDAPGLEETVADFALSLLDDVAQQYPFDGGDASSSGSS